MTNTPNRGLTALIRETIARYQPSQFDFYWLKTSMKSDHPWDDRQIQAALSAMSRSKELTRTGSRGTFQYIVPTTADSRSPVELIDNLLTCMAEAEPVLRRCKKLLDAIDATN